MNTAPRSLEALLNETPSGVCAAFEEGVLSLVLDNPPGNRLSLDLIRSLSQTIQLIGDEPVIRAVWLGAAGPDFSHGVDLSDPDLVAQISRGADGICEVAQLGQQLIDGWADLRVPTVTSARGHVIGGGAGLWLASDFRFLGDDASVCFPEVDRGIYLGWGLVPRLVRELGMPTARALALAGERLNIDAFPVGTVRRAPAEDVDERGMALARSLADKPAPAVRAIKAALVELSAPDRASASADPARTAETMATPEFLEAIARWRKS